MKVKVCCKAFCKSSFRNSLRIVLRPKFVSRLVVGKRGSKDSYAMGTKSFFLCAEVVTM